MRTLRTVASRFRYPIFSLPTPALPLALLTLVMVTGIVRPAPASAAEGALVSHAEYTISAAERFAHVTATLRVSALKKGWQRIPLLPSSMPLQSFKVEGKKGYLERAADHYVAHLLGEGEYIIQLSFVLDVRTRRGARLLLLPLIRTISARIAFQAAVPNHVVKTMPEVPIDLVSDATSTRATIFPGDLSALTILWLPAEFEKKPAAVFEAHEESLIFLDTTSVKEYAHFTVTVRRGEVDSLSVTIPPGVDVLKVAGSSRGTPIIDNWRLDREATQPRIHIRFKEPLTGRFHLYLVSEMVLDAEAAFTRILPFRIEKAQRQTGYLSIAASPSLTVVDAGSIGVRQAVPSAPSVAAPPEDLTSRLKASPLALAFEYNKLPAELRLRVTPVLPEISAVTASRVHLRAGVVELLEEIRYRVENVPIDRLRLGFDAGLIVLDVTGEGIETWEASANELEVRLKQPVIGNYVLTVKCVEDLRQVDGLLIPGLRALDARRQSGSVGISAAGDVALLHHHSRKFVQVDVDQLGDWVRQGNPKLAYLYDQPDGELAVSTSLIEPVLRVEGYGTARVGEDTLEEEYLFLCTVERQSLFGLRLALPQGLVPISLVGERVADWEFHPDQRSLSVALDRAFLGEMTLHLFTERRFEPDTTELPLGGVSIADAEYARGHLGLATNVNLELLPGDVRGMVAIDIKEAPPLVKTLPNLALAYRWSGQDWGMVLRTRRLIPRIEVDTATALVFGAGHVRALTDVTWHIARASVAELVVELPEGAFNSTLTGKNIQGSELTDNAWQVRLTEPLKGDHKMRITYETLPDPQSGKLTHTGIRLPQAERQRGIIGTYLEDPQVEVTVGELQNAQATGTAPAIDVGDASFLGGYSFAEAHRRIEFQLTGHALAEGVRLNAEDYHIATVVKEQGSATSYMNCRVRNAGAQFFKLRLPEGAVLWGTYIQGKAVKPNKLAQGDILIPLLEAPRGRPFDLGVIWSQSLKKMGPGSSLTLNAPGLALPSQAVDWDVYLPRNYQVLSARGNMRLLAREAWYEQGLPRILWGYLQAAWPVVKTILIILAWLVGLGVLGYLIYRIAKIVRSHLALRAAIPAEARRPVWIRVTIWFGVVVVLLILVAMLMPAGHRAQEMARGAKSQINLKHIGTALVMYQNNYGGYMPASLNDLVGTYLGEDLLRSPETHEPYVYNPRIALSKSSPEKTIAWERPDKKRKTRVLFRDGRVENITVAEGADLGTWGKPYVWEYGEQERPPGDEAMDLGVAQAPAPTKPPGPGAEVERPPAPVEAMTPELAEPREGTPELAIEDEARARSRLQKKEADEWARSQRAKEMARAYEKKGDYKSAEEQLDLALKYRPEGEDVRQDLARLRELQKLARAPKKAFPGRPVDEHLPSGLEQPEDLAKGEQEYQKEREAREGRAPVLTPPPPRQTRTESVGDLIALSDKLKQEAGARWDADVADTPRERDLLNLVTGRKDKVEFGTQAAVRLEKSELVVHGDKEGIQEVTETARRLRASLLEASREITRQKQARQARVAARRRAELQRRALAATTVKARIGGGTVRGSRAAGVMPLEISFPSVGTKAYPFHMDYAGTSQPRIELTCLRRGSAMVLQGLIGILVLLVVTTLAWRDVRWGAVAAALLALVLILLMRTGAEAVKPYVVMGLVGLGAALPLVAWRLATLIRPRAVRT